MPRACGFARPPSSPCAEIEICHVTYSAPAASSIPEMNHPWSRIAAIRACAVLLVSLLFLAQNAPAQNEVGSKPAALRIFLIGDSTVRNGKGDGAGGLWGWGDFFAAHFDTNKVRVFNRALGGRSSRTFFTEGLWEKVRADLRPGDFVLMQFGHNDGGELSQGDRP